MMLRVALLLLAAIVAVSCDEAPASLWRFLGHPENDGATEAPNNHGRSPEHAEDHGTIEAPNNHGRSPGHPEDHGTTEAPNNHGRSSGHPEDHGTTEAPHNHGRSPVHPEDHGTTEAPNNHGRSPGHQGDHGTTEAPNNRGRSPGHQGDHGTTEAPNNHGRSPGHPEDHASAETSSHHRQFHPVPRPPPLQPILHRRPKPLPALYRRPHILQPAPHRPPHPAPHRPQPPPQPISHRRPKPLPAPHRRPQILRPAPFRRPQIPRPPPHRRPYPPQPSTHRRPQILQPAPMWRPTASSTTHAQPQSYSKFFETTATLPHPIYSNYICNTFKSGANSAEKIVPTNMDCRDDIRFASFMRAMQMLARDNGETNNGEGGDDDNSDEDDEEEETEGEQGETEGEQMEETEGEQGETEGEREETEGEEQETEGEEQETEGEEQETEGEQGETEGEEQETEGEEQETEGEEQETEGEQGETEGEQGETEGEQNMEDELRGRSLNELRMFASRALDNPSTPYGTPHGEVYDMVRTFLMSDDMSEEDEKEMHVKMLMSLKGKITVNLPKKRHGRYNRPDRCPEIVFPRDMPDSLLREMVELSLQKPMTSSDHSKIDVTALMDTMKDLYKQKDDVITYFDSLMADSTFKDMGAACYLLELYAGSPTTPCGIAAIATAAYDKFHCHVNTSLGGRSPAASRLRAASEEPFFLTTRIVGGSPTGSCAAVPWQARISRNGRQHCGGSILDSTHILTAAHCFDRDSGRFVVTVGDYDLRRRESTEQRFSIRRRDIKIHPRYKDNVFDYDIAIIKLPRPIKLNRRCAKAIRLRRNFNLNGQRCTVSGWGRTSYGGRISQTLRSVRVETHKGENCVSAFNIPQRSYMQPRPRTKVCAGDRRGGRDACVGDSGGPLICRDRSSNTFVQVGIVSYGEGCGRARYPGVYTSTSAYYRWIKRNM